MVLGPFGFEESNRVSAIYDIQESKLSLDMKANKEAYRPGEDVEIDLSVKNSQGAGQQSVVNVSAVDEALFHILPYNFTRPLLETLYGQISVRSYSGSTKFLSRSFDSDDTFGLSESASMGAELGGCFTAETQILLPDGSTRSIKDIRKGDVILTLKSENNPSRETAVVQGLSTHDVPGYMIINGELELTPEHVVFVNGEWLEAAYLKSGDVMKNEQGNPVPVRTIDYVVQPTTVYNIIVDPYHTYIADGYYVHNAEKGGGVRTNFVDAAYFDTVKTDAQGNARISFVAPDNITSWRVTGRAYESESIMAGEQTIDIATTLPLFVDATLASTYLTGDAPILKVRAFGESLNLNESVTIFVSSTDLSIREERVVSDPIAYIQLPVFSRTGEFDIEVRATQGNLTDALIETIDVQESYLLEPVNETQRAVKNQTEFSGAQNGPTEITVVDAGYGQYYYPLRRMRYWSGIRFDSQLAYEVSQETLNTYFGEERRSEADIEDYFVADKGGYGLLTYADADLELSAFAADAAPDHVFRTKLREYFTSSMEDEVADIDRIATALYGLASLGEPVLAQTQFLSASDELTDNARYFVALHLQELVILNVLDLYINNILEVL